MKKDTRRQLAIGLGIGSVIVIGFLVAVFISGQRAPMTAPRVAAAPSPLADDVRLIRVSIIGDSYTSGSNQGGNADANWVRVLGLKLENERRIRLATQLLAVGGSGYTRPGAGDDKSTFVDRAARVDPDSDLVVFFGSRNDGITPDQVPAAAAKAFNLVKAGAPNARLLVVGVPWVSSNVPATITQVNNSLRSTTQAAGGTFADPSLWLADQGVIGTDGVHPTDRGHQIIAQNMYPLFVQQITALPRTR